MCPRRPVSILNRVSIGDRLAQRQGGQIAGRSIAELMISSLPLDFRTARFGINALALPTHRRPRLSRHHTPSSLICSTVSTIRLSPIRKR